MLIVHIIKYRQIFKMYIVFMITINLFMDKLILIFLMDYFMEIFAILIAKLLKKYFYKITKLMNFWILIFVWNFKVNFRLNFIWKMDSNNRWIIIWNLSMIRLSLLFLFMTKKHSKNFQVKIVSKQVLWLYIVYGLVIY